MPEGPEIAYLAHTMQELIGQSLGKHGKVTNVLSKGKVLLIQFKHSTLVFHFGLTGWLSTDKAPWTRRTFHFSKTTLYFTDPRRFGSTRFVHDDPIPGLAPDVYEITWDEFKKRKRDGPIASLLLDQKGIVSGVGNYLRSEILYKARVSPFKTHLTDAEWRKVYLVMKSITKNILNRMVHGKPVHLSVYRHPNARKATMNGRTVWY